MLYSQLLLSKKGALGIIWMAAHCHKRLKKDQVQQTDISSSVDKILDDEVPVVTHRILAFLLLGVVRIYSKKVEYLFHDCHEMLNRLCGFKTGKTTRAGIGVSQTHYHSITLPTRFELDTFDLDLLEDQMCGNVRSHEQDTLADGHKKKGGTSCLLYKDSLRHSQENIPISEAYSTAYTPPRDVFGSHHMDQNLCLNPSSNMNISLAGVEILRGTHFSLGDRLDPILLDGVEEEQMHNKLSEEDLMTYSQRPTSDLHSDSVASLSNNRSHSLPGLDIFRDAWFALEDRLEPMVLDEAEKEQLGDRPSIDNTSSNLQGPLQEKQMHDKLSDKDLRTNFQGPTNDMESDVVASLSNNRSHSLRSLEMFRGTGFPLEELLEPMVLDKAKNEQLHDRLSNDNTNSSFWGPIQDVEFNFVANKSPKGGDSVASLGILYESGFSLEHSSNFKMSNEAEKREGHDKPSHEEHGIEEEHLEHMSIQLSFQEAEHHDFTGSVDKVKPVDAKMKRLEVITLESVKCQRPEEFCVFTVNPDPKLPAGVGTPDVATVQTPGRKESAKILKKRKTMFDLATVLPNKVFKSWIEQDPTDLKRGRREVPHTVLHAWRSHKLGNFPQSFFDPLIPGISVDLRYLECKKSRAPEIKSMGPSASRGGVRSPVTHGSREQIPDVRSPVIEKSPRQTPDVRSHVTETSPNQTPIAPGTPLAHLNSLRSHEAGAIADSDILEPATSLESIEKWTSSSEPLEWDVLFQEETSLLEGDSLKKDIYSTRTRMTGSYLGRKFLDKKRWKDEEALNLSHLLAGKTKTESARLFYEILVLKTQGCIDVQQETAYHDIRLRETPKLRQVFGN